MANINDFKSQLYGGGARANQFKVFLNFPGFVSASGSIAAIEAQFLCKAASLPGSTVADVEVMYRGRQVHFAGERTFQPWTVTIYNDVNNNIRNAFEYWQSGIQRYTATGGLTNPSDYQMPLLVHQLDRNGAPTKIYQFHDAYPTSISPINLDYDTQNQIETFDVEFTYNYFTSNRGTDGDGSSFGLNVSIDTPIGSLPISF